MLIKFLKKKKAGGKDMVKGMTDALSVGSEGRNKPVNSAEAAGLKINPCRDLCNTPGAGESPHKRQIIQNSDRLGKEVTWSTCSNLGPWGKERKTKRERRGGWIFICSDPLASNKIKTLNQQATGGYCFPG